jgi:hypothetical protein
MDEMCTTLTAHPNTGFSHLLEASQAIEKPVSLGRKGLEPELGLDDE